MIKVLVVDDTIFYRKIISDVLSEMPNVEVVGTANNGSIALSRIKTTKPDLITLDVEMPVMNGLELLAAIQKDNIDVDAVMLSSKTDKGSEATMQALELGAFDFISKPDEESPGANKAFIKKALAKIMQAYGRRREMKSKGGGLLLSRKPVASQAKVVFRKLKRTEKSHMVAIGISTGGPQALAKMLPMLPADIGVPVFIVQHMPPLFSASMAKSLDKKCSLTVKEAVNGEEVRPNTIYIAPGDKQMMVASGVGMKKIIRVNDDPPENNCRPAADYLFRAVAREYGSKATCVIMTGMGVDGRLGLTVAKAAGAVSIAQNAETCVVYGMPKVVIEAKLADVVAPLDKIAEEILKTLK